MPAKRSINFRSGDLAEQLGLLILQNIALVAPIPRTEDRGRWGRCRCYIVRRS